MTFDRVMPILTTGKAECVRTLASHRSCFYVLHFNCIVAVWRRTPPQQPITLQVKIKFIYTSHKMHT